MEQEFKKRKLESEGVFVSDILEQVYIPEVILFNYIHNMYPECISLYQKSGWYKVKNFDIKYDINDKENEDLTLDFMYLKDNLIGDKCYLSEFKEKYEGVPIIIDGNKIVIYENWCKNISDEIMTLILIYQIDIIIIRDINFNYPIDKLPNRIKSLKIYSDVFNQSVDSLPSSLQILCIKSSTWDTDSFNQPINNLPLKLEELVIYSTDFNQPVNKLPNSLLKLYIGGNDGDFNQSLHRLPKELKILCICSNDFEQKLDKLPESIELLFIEYHTGYSDVLDNLPQNLKTLYYGFYSGKNPDSEKSYSIDNLPRGIKNIHLGSSFNNSLDNLPESVIEIYIGDEEQNFNIPINNLPHGLQKIYISKISEQIDYINFDSPPQDIYNDRSIIFNNENFTIAKKVFSNLDFNEKQKVLKRVHRIFDWEEVGYQLSCDI